MSNVTLTSRKSEQDREIENLWSTDHALHVYPHGSTLLGESQVAEYSPLIELDSSSGLSTVYRDTSTTTIPLVSFRKKNNRQDEAISVKVNGVAIATDTNSLWEIIIGGSLTDASFGSVTRVADSETALEVDTSATTISGGTAIDKGMAVGGQGSSSALAGIRGLGLDIPDDTVVTLAIRTVSGTGSASTAFALEEEF